MINKESFSISPGTNIMDVLGHSGYTFDFAIADLIDNCIAAHATEIEIFVDTTCKEPYLYILDNGEGMTLPRLKQAAIIGFKDIGDIRDSSDLGRFSTGLKSAAKSICNNMYISSKVKNQNVNTIQLDFDYIKHEQKWEAFVINDSKIESKLGEQGTIIYCDRLLLGNNLHGTLLYEKIDELEHSLSHIFGKYLISKEIKISVQISGSIKNVLIGWNPFGLLHDGSTKKIFEKEEKYKDSCVCIKAYVLPVHNNLDSTDQKYMIGKGLLEQQGFYIYRNRRLIHEGGWLNLPNLSLDEKSKYARIEVDIDSSLDEDFKINFSKNSLIIPDELQPLFIGVAKKVRSEARKSANYLKHPELKKKAKEDESRIWQTSHSNIGTILTINAEHPIIMDLCKNLTKQEKNKLFQLLSKSLPIAMIQEQSMGVKDYTEKEIWDLAKDFYNREIGEGATIKEIKVKMRTTEPFKDYIPYVVSFFENMEEK